MKNLSIGILTILLIACKTQHVNQTSTSNNGSASSDSVEISENTARMMVHKYHPNAIDLRVKTRTVWLSMSRIQQLYDKLRRDSADGMGTDGIRFYFAKYPKKDELGKFYSHAHRNTLVIVSTKKTDTFHQDYFDNKNKNLLLPFVENKGELCPPGDCQGALLLEKN